MAERGAGEQTWEAEMFRLLVENVLDYAIFVVDPHRHILSWSKGAERLLGFTEAEIVGRQCDHFFTPEDVRRGVPQAELEQALATGRGEDDRWHQRKDGTRFWCSGVVTPLKDEGGRLRGFAKIMRDRTDLKRAEEQLRRVEARRTARLAVTQVLADAASVREAAPLILKTVSEALSWDVGALWTVDREAGVLRCVDVRSCGGGSAAAFEAATRTAALRPNTSLPGRVWHTGGPLWIPDVAGDPQFQRAAVAAEAGLHGAFACPIRLGDDFLGVVEFFSRDIREPDPDLLEMMTTLGGQIGQFMERRRAEAALRHSEERFRSLMEQAPFSIQVFSPDGRTLRVNRAWEDLWGVRFEQIGGYNVLEDRQLEARGILRYIHQGFAGRSAHIPAIEYNPNETIPDVTDRADPRRWLSAVIYPIKDAEDRVQEVVLVHEDVTARHRAEAELRDARSRLDAALEAGAIVTWTWDIPNNRLFADDNLARLFNLPPAEAEGGSLDGYIRSIHPDDWPRVSAALTCSVEGGGEYEADYRIVQPDGSVRWMAARGRVERDERGRPVRMPGVLVDITDRKRLEEELRVRVEQLAEADRRKEDLLASLRESEEKLRLLADTIPQLAWMASPDGDIFWYNRRWYEYTGTTPEEMRGWGWQSVHDPVELPKVLEGWRASLASGEPFEMVFPLRGADGLFRSFLTRVNPLRDQHGRVVYWFGTNTDVEDQKRSQEALAESERRFRQLADAMPQIVWTARPDGNIEYMNRQWHAFTGLPEALGNDGWAHILHPDDAPHAHERWAASVRSGAPFEMEIRLLDRRRQAYRWHLIRTVADHDEAGRVARWFGSSTDIDAQKRAEESSRYLAEASATLASVVDYESTLQKVAALAVPYFADWSAVDVADGDGSLRRLAVAHQDAGKVALVRRLMREYPPDPESPTGAFAVLRTGRPQLLGEIPDDMLAQAAKDERHLALLRSLGLKSYLCVPLVASGSPLGVLTFATAESGRTYSEADLALATDLAQRAGVAVENARLYRALREADRRKDEFLATLAHELRNPLAPIRNALQILNMPRVDAETARRSREMMERQVHHLVRLVDDLLDVSRVMRGKIELRRERVELASVVARAVETVQPLVDAQRHQLSVRLPSESLPLDADPVRLAQVVGNILTNAAKYTEPGGRIWLAADLDGDTAELRVRDSGIGIAPQMLPRIFELFVQADHASTKAQGGLGIGLTLVQNLVEMHNGTVEARSEGLGKGSEFVVRLPISAQQLREDRGEPGQRADPVAASGLRLLVVDDNQDAAVSLATLLELQGHEVRVAHSGPAALEMANTFPPDLIFLDIGMPGMDGYEVARRLRQRPGLESVVLAALTGWGQQEDRRRTAEAGFDHHLVKPPDPKALESLLAGLNGRNRGAVH